MRGRLRGIVSKRRGSRYISGQTGALAQGEEPGRAGGARPDGKKIWGATRRSPASHHQVVSVASPIRQEVLIRIFVSFRRTQQKT
jgi:hypothetical protein